MSRSKLIPYNIFFGACILFTSLGFHIYYDTYESLFASFVSGQYTTPIRDIDIDFHFLLFPVYSFINHFTYPLPLYGIIIYSLSVFSSFFFIHQCIRVLQQVRFRTVLYYLIIAIVVIENNIEISTTKSAFFLCFGLMIHLFVKSENHLSEKIKFLLICVLMGLFRLDALLFLCVMMVLLYFSVIRGKKPNLLLPTLLIGLTFWGGHKMLLYHSSEAKNVFYYLEYDLFDRDNIKYESLNATEQVQVSALKNYIITDDYHYTYSFVNKVLGNHSENKPFYTSIDIRSFFNTLLFSPEKFLSKIHIIGLAFFIYLMILFSRGSLWNKLIFSAFFFLPIPMNIFLSTPSRFLSPYYLSFTVLGTALFLNKARMIYLAYIPLIIYSLYHYTVLSRNVLGGDQLYNDNLSYLEKWSKKEKPVIIDTEKTYDFLPKKINDLIYRQDALFLNLYFFNSYETYQERWEAECRCNPLSLQDKMTYISDNQLYVLSNDTRMKFYQEYFDKIYNEKMTYTLKDSSHHDLNLYTISLQH